MTESLKVTETLKTAILGIIRTKLTLGPNVRVSIGCEKYVHLMKCAMDIDLISNDEINSVVHDRLCQFGREEYELCLKRLWSPCNIASIEALEYAMVHELSNEEIGRLKFDHGQGKFDYMNDPAVYYLRKSVVHKLRHNLVFCDLIYFVKEVCG